MWRGEECGGSERWKKGWGPWREWGHGEVRSMRVWGCEGVRGVGKEAVQVDGRWTEIRM